MQIPANSEALIGTYAESGRLAFILDQLRILTGDLGSSQLTSRLVSSANSDNATVVKATPGVVGRVQVYNNNAAGRYLKFYNKATAPTSADIPVWVEYLPPTSKTAFDLGALPFSIGIGFRLVTGNADNDNTAVGAGDILALNIAYT